RRTMPDASLLLDEIYGWTNGHPAMSTALIREVRAAHDTTSDVPTQMQRAIAKVTARNSPEEKSLESKGEAFRRELCKRHVEVAARKLFFDNVREYENSIAVIDRVFDDRGQGFDNTRAQAGVASSLWSRLGGGPRILFSRRVLRCSPPARARCMKRGTGGVPESRSGGDPYTADMERFKV
ncbi:MAG TPA: hypothetical protein PKI03_23180, partial [Pseudomonadota bacterium]|nr:hypothetical protein [Pseudomonadota bacterium]